MSFTKKILIGVFAGIVLGIFFGELIEPLGTVGDIKMGRDALKGYAGMVW